MTNPGDPNDHPPVNQAPSVSIAQPGNGSSFSLPAVLEVIANASDTDGSVVKVEFFSGDRSWGAATAIPYRILADLAIGQHSLTAKATDDQGASKVSSPVQVAVEAPAPVAISDSGLGESGLTLSWRDGGGPFAVQAQESIGGPWCVIGSITASREALLPVMNPAGFFRVADLASHEAIGFTSALSGGMARPDPVVTDATGSGEFSLEGNTLSFEVSYSGLSATALGAHIHGPASANETAGVLIDLAPFNGGGFGAAGTLSGSVVLDNNQKAAILSGRTYVNIHTPANPNGEIRGQIAPAAMQATLNGAKVRPNRVDTTGSGTGHFVLSGEQLRFSITYRGLSGTAVAAHLHGPATTEESAGVLLNLEPFDGGGFGASDAFSGEATLNAQQLAAVIDGLAYVNIHTPENPAGELRGQIVPCVTSVPFTTTLSGDNARPDPVVTDGTGSAVFGLEGNILSFDLSYSGLGGAAVAAHIHGPASENETAGVLIDLGPFNGGGFGAAGTLSGSVVVNDEQKAAILAGQTYVNLHTPANPSGEIRGRIVR